MNQVNKTLYIPLYGKAYVSERNLILKDKKAEEIWKLEGFPLKGKSKSKWLAFYMGMRASVFDRWVRNCMQEEADAVVLHIGCGMDSRALRVGIGGHQWYDVDFTQVIEERKKYYTETNEYHMISTDVREHKWMDQLSQYNNAIVIMEGVSMYVTLEQLRGLYRELGKRFEKMRILVDCYTEFAAKISKYKNPINDVGVRSVYGISQPEILETDTGLQFVKEHEMTPACDMDQLKGMEKKIFQKVYGGRFAKKMYRLYEYSWQNC